MRNDTPRTFIGATTFQVTGMSCAHCRDTIIEAITRIGGVDAVTVDLAGGTVTVTVDRPVDRADIAAAVEEAGYTFTP